MKQPHVPTTPRREFVLPWEDAFDKFGFGDGAYGGITFDIADVLEDNGYDVNVSNYGFHNAVIFSIKHNGQELMPVDDPEVTIGYSDPRTYLPQEIQILLEDVFG